MAESKEIEKEELSEMLNGVLVLLSWQTDLVRGALGHLAEEQGAESGGPGGSGATETPKKPR